jgi:hypothetical protein
MPSHNERVRVGVATEAPRCHVYLWSSSKPTKTNPSAGFSCYAESFPRSPKPDTDTGYIAFAQPPSIPLHRLFGCHSVGRQIPLATGKLPNISGNTLHRQTALGIRADSWERSGVARFYTTACVLLKQPDKQKSPSRPLVNECVMLEERPFFDHLEFSADLCPVTQEAAGSLA